MQRYMGRYPSNTLQDAALSRDSGKVGTARICSRMHRYKGNQGARRLVDLSIVVVVVHHRWAYKGMDMLQDAPL